MKKVSLLIATLLVLVSSIIFCGCNDGYKNLKIECNVEEINLVLDNEKLSTQNVIFELSGAKSWGEITIVSKPLGLVQTKHEIDGKKCGVVVSALQPSGDGASLVITHLGSGKSLEIPLNVGLKLKSVTGANKDFVVKLPTEFGENGQKEVEIPTKQLLNCNPLNYTDNIVWQSTSTALTSGVSIVSYDSSGEVIKAFTDIEEYGDNRKGTSSAVKSTIIIDENCTSNASITINPISVLDGEAILYKNIAVNVYIMDLLASDDIQVTSQTHGNTDGVLEDLVLISNPDAEKPRTIANLSGYDYYSTAIIDLKANDKDVLKTLTEANAKFANLYEMELSTNIDALRLENVDFGKIRVIATSTCLGVGEITVKFVPKACVGEVQEFSINIPCTVGERATSYSATNNGSVIAITQDDEYTFSSVTPLNDSNALGQAFRFDVLSTSTLDALSNYKITINKNLLYINPQYIDTSSNTSSYIRQSDDSGYLTLTDILNNKYDYQVSILKDGREVTFYEDGNNFVSESLSGRNTIYMKWVKTDGTNSIEDGYFGISITNCYDNRYDIANHGFENTLITYNLAFNRQRTIETISYVPVKISNGGNLIEMAGDYANDWQFYFEPAMFDDTTTFYGVYIEEVLGLNSTALTADELGNINLDVIISGINLVVNAGEQVKVNLGFALFSRDKAVNGGFVYENLLKFNFDSTTNADKNIIIIGKTGNVNYGDYEISISQNNREISTRNVRVYKTLEECDVTISLPNAEYGGKMLRYEKLDGAPSDWAENYSAYYEYAGGQYISVSNPTWNERKAYYKQVDVTVLIGEESKIIHDDTYIVATSKDYIIDVAVANVDFVNLNNQEVDAVIVGESGAVLDKSYISNLISKDSQGKHIISTGAKGSFNTSAGEKNFIQLSYKITANTYDYYKVNAENETSVEKIIYIYVYEPLTSAAFDHTMIYKYDYDSILNEQLKKEYGKQTLNIRLNSNSVFDYVDVQWKTSGDGILSCEEITKNSATYTFDTMTGSSTIMALITQFGVQYPIYCGFSVTTPVLSETLELNNTTHTFVSGNPYISLKVGETIDISATAKSSKGEVSFNGLEYVICSTTGYATSSVASIDANGKLTALNAGRVKLIVMAQDVLKTSLISVSNYFDFTTYIQGNAYVMIDILVADGSSEYPYLIASANDFKGIANDISNGKNDKHYALINDIDLNGASISLEEFEGTITSFQENANSTNPNRFAIYGIILTEVSPTLFKQLNLREDNLANLENIDFHIDINYKEIGKKSGEILIGLVGNNIGYIHNITVTISGSIDANNLQNNYIIGSISAKNNGNVTIDGTTLVGVQGSITVGGSASATVILGGVIGINEGVLVGANIKPQTSGTSEDVEYEVYYGSQGATAEIELQVKNGLIDSAMGGVIGYNYNGTMTDVYVTGKVLGMDDINNLTVNNIGGLIGKNNGQGNITTIIESEKANVKSVKFNPDAVFQINNSYSSATVKGNQNVGGVVGYDNRGSYKKVYYEIYTVNESVVGNANVGGLIGSANDSNLYYCYANNFAWNYGSSVEVYDIIGNTNVGGLIGLAVSSRNSNFTTQTYSYSAMNIVSSVASVNIKSINNASGLLGRLNGYGAIYTTYYYGVIDAKDVSAITKIYKDGSNISNIPYNNAYTIVANMLDINVNQVYMEQDDVVTLVASEGFAVNKQYNNGKPYVTDENDASLVSIIPTIIQINTAFTTYYNALYKQNDKSGEYVWDGENKQYVEYNSTTHEGMSRYSLMASLAETGDTSGNLSNYREQVLVLYYYQFSDMSGENALRDWYGLNTIDMHDIVNDNGIIVLPNTFRRFNLRSSNEAVVSVLSDGKLLLRNEGQVTITLISTLNPSATASFVVIVRSKVLKFALYSSANIRDEYNIENSTLSIVKGTSKLIYADYSSTITYNNEYSYASPTNMEIDFAIAYTGELPIDKTISNYITLNGAYNEETGKYTIPYGMPITVSVLDYVADGYFTITATPYVVANYINGDYSTKVRVALSGYFNTQFNVITKKGASAINTDKTQIDMMPADEPANLDVKISTDVKVDKLYFEIVAIGENDSVVNVLNPNEIINFTEMLDVLYIYTNTADAESRGSILFTQNDNNATAMLDLSNMKFVDGALMQQVKLNLTLNEKSYYVDEAFRLQIKLYVLNGNNQVSTILHVDVKPQAINSVIPLNYRMKEGEQIANLANAYLSDVIRPGSTNIITIDLAPSTAIYDYVEIMDATTQDKILFQQVNADLSDMDYMDEWVDSGIKLKKYDATTSKLYVLAKLPLNSTANIAHTVQINVYNKAGKVLTTAYLNLEAIMYPTVVMTYTPPKGASVTANTNYGNAQHEIVKMADLAVGVEADIDVVTYNIDEGSLQSSITIKDGNTIIANDNYITLEFLYDKYYLRFNNNKDWSTLIGKNIEVTFTATKHLNNVTESCSATISFSIKRMVIHGISMTHTNSKGELYGSWDTEFSTQFYFDYKDISYYSSGYWNKTYTIENTNTESIVNERLKRDFDTINNILTELNTLGSDGVTVLFGVENNMTPLLKNYNDGDISVINENNSFVIKAREGSNINSMHMSIEFKVGYDAQNYPCVDNSGLLITNEFGFDITPETSPFDEYLTVSSQEEFESMQEGKHYQLTKDLIFTNYTPINTAIAAFNGNGYKITISKQTNNNVTTEGFNVGQLVQNYISGGMYVGLFGRLAEDSVIQNLQVNYDNITLNFSSSETMQQQHTNNIYFGGIAGVNLGVITNVKVLGSFKVIAPYISAEQINLGGIASSNGSTASTKVATITGSTVEISMSGMALIGGVSGTNYGKITNTNFKGKIESIDDEDNNQYASNIFTAGFVIENTSNGYISLSYVNCGLVSGEYSIRSVGRTVGFVFENAGTINNSYINQTSIRSQGNIGGFVYQNSGTLTNCYAHATLDNSLFYEEFIYSTVDVGKLANCYVITDSTKSVKVDGLKVIKTVNMNVQDNYAGFIFASRQNGIWSITDYGPQLQHAGFNDNRSEYNSTYNIYDIETFDGFFSSTNEVIEGKTFRIVRDIDFSQAEVQGNPITFNKTLLASLEGNDMTLMNYNIYKTGDVSSIGLFANIGTQGTNIYVRNLILKPSSIKATGSVAVGGLAGTVDGANIYNIKIDNSELLILGKNVVGGLAGIIKGNFEVMGIESNISAFASYTHNIAEQYNLYTGKHVTGSPYIDNLDVVSYAGAIAGIVNGYGNSVGIGGSSRNIDNYCIISNITATNDLVLIAETVGGVFGVIGETTLVKNVSYNLSSDTQYQAVYVAGGLVGENRGIIQNAHIYAVDENSVTGERASTITCFNNFAKVNGGIVGLNIGGLIYNCSSDIDICTTKDLATAGGIVGRNIEGSVYNCTVSGNVDAYFAGGIAGTDYSYATIIDQRVGYGTATADTRRVYNTVKLGVNYANCIEKYDINRLYDKNLITNNFLTNFIAKIDKYYSFNTSYVDEATNLVSANSVYGLVVGFTDTVYGVEYVYNNNGLEVGLLIDSESAPRSKYQVTYYDKQYVLEPIANIVSSLVEKDTFELWYLIGYDNSQNNAKYEFWSSTLGYTNQYILVTGEYLTEV